MCMNIQSNKRNKKKSFHFFYKRQNNWLSFQQHSSKAALYRYFFAGDISYFCLLLFVFLNSHGWDPNTTEKIEDNELSKT